MPSGLTTKIDIVTLVRIYEKKQQETFQSTRITKEYRINLGDKTEYCYNATKLNYQIKQHQARKIAGVQVVQWFV